MSKSKLLPKKDSFSPSSETKTIETRSAALYKDLRKQFPDEMKQLGVDDLLSSGYNSCFVFSFPCEHLKCDIDLRLLEICLKQQRQINELVGKAK